MQKMLFPGVFLFHFVPAAADMDVFIAMAMLHMLFHRFILFSHEQVDEGAH